MSCSGRVAASESTASELSFPSVCVSALKSAQNEDSGWPFQSGHTSRVEPTCWALLALLQTGARTDSDPYIARGVQFLLSSQLPDGSWPAVLGQKTGSWVTSLACWTLFAAQSSSGAAVSGLRWLCDDWPRDSSRWRRALHRLFPVNVVHHNDAYRGWGWTPHTGSWVEPTSLALIALSQCPPHLLPRAAARRQRLATLLLCDRMCPAGGWNCGNPRTYGVDGESLVIPTAWALIALRNEQESREVEAGRRWLESNLENIEGVGSLALARICLELFGRDAKITDERIRRTFLANQFLQNTSALAWASLACGPRPRWPTISARAA